MTKLAVYGKGGIGKSTTASNISIALARRGKRVLQIGCDPKADSTFTLTGFLIPSIISTLQAKDYHYEDVWPEDVIYKGYGGVDCVESGGPPAGAGCGGYVVGETVKLLKELNAFYEYDVILFDVLGDVVCGGFAAPLNFCQYCLIVTDNGFDALFAANRIAASVREKAKSHPLRLVGLIGNRTLERDLIDKFVEACPFPILELIPTIEDIRISRVKGKTLFEMMEESAAGHNDRSVQVRGGVGLQDTLTVGPGSASPLKYLCDFYLNIADQLLSQPEGVVPREVEDRALFRLLSDFYLGASDAGPTAAQKNSGIVRDDERKVHVAAGGFAMPLSVEGDGPTVIAAGPVLVQEASMGLALNGPLIEHQASSSDIQEGTHSNEPLVETLLSSELDFLIV